MPLVADFDGYSWNQQVFGKPQMMRIKNLTTKGGNAQGQSSDGS